MKRARAFTAAWGAVPEGWTELQDRRDRLAFLRWKCAARQPREAESRRGRRW